MSETKEAASPINSKMLFFQFLSNQASNYLVFLQRLTNSLILSTKVYENPQDNNYAGIFEKACPI